MGEISGLRKVCLNRHCGAEICYVNLCCISIAQKWLVYTVYRVFHDLSTLLQEVISEVFVIKKVHINMCPILDGYGVMTA